MTVKHAYAVGDKVVYTNCFGVCWGVRTIKELDERAGRPTYYIDPTDTPWFSVGEEHLKLADHDDLAASELNAMTDTYFQAKHGFTPKDYFGCW